jgi:hypothetical protein
MKVGDYVSFDIYRPSAREFLSTYKGVIIAKEERPNLAGYGPLFQILSMDGELYTNIERSSIRVLRPS